MVETGTWYEKRSVNLAKAPTGKHKPQKTGERLDPAPFGISAGSFCNRWTKSGVSIEGNGTIQRE
jgi:hypothetical protein